MEDTGWREKHEEQQKKDTMEWGTQKKKEKRLRVRGKALKNEYVYAGDLSQ